MSNIVPFHFHIRSASLHRAATVVWPPHFSHYNEVCQICQSIRCSVMMVSSLQLIEFSVHRYLADWQRCKTVKQSNWLCQWTTISENRLEYLISCCRISKTNRRQAYELKHPITDMKHIDSSLTNKHRKKQTHKETDAQLDSKTNREKHRQTTYQTYFK